MFAAIFFKTTLVQGRDNRDDRLLTR